MAPSAPAQPPDFSSLGRSVSMTHATMLLSVSKRTLYNWIRDGRLQTIRVGRSQRVLVESFAGLAPRGTRRKVIQP